MIGRSIWGILTGAMLLLPSAAGAQSPYAPSPIQQTGYAGPPKDGIPQAFRDVGRSVHHLAEPVLPPVFTSPHNGTSYYQASPSGPGYDLLHGGPYGACPPGGPCPGGIAQTSYELLPDDRYCEPGLHCDAIGEALQYTWMRFEYLNYSIEDPGDVLIGAPVRGLNEREGTIISTGLPVIDPSGVSYFIPDTSPLDLSSNNGVRATLGIPTRIGTLEASIWTLAQADDAVVYTPEPLLLGGFPTGLLVVPGTSLEIDGQPGQVVPTNVTSTILYDQGYSASTSTHLFGTEGMFVFNPVTPNQHLQFQPVLGIQWINFRERFVVAGRDNFTNTNHEINSRSRNNIFGPTIGFRAELLLHERVTLGVTPKLLVGFNRHKDTVFTQQNLSATEPQITTQDTDSDFAPGFDLSTSVRVKVSDHLSIFVSYQLYLLSQVSRPYENISYNEITPQMPNIILDAERQNMMVQGLTVGGELRFH